MTNRGILRSILSLAWTMGPCVLADAQPCNSGADCGSNKWCQFPPGVCSSDEPLGTCHPIGDVCAQYIDPVCGCDFQSYQNEGCAAAAQVSILYAGACGPPPCGGYAGLPCAAGEYCHVTLGSCATHFGLCEPAPSSCPEACQPVCGCDESDYASECHARLAGVDVLHAGPCNSPTDGVVGGEGFDALRRLFWSPESGAESYNVYLRKETGPPASGTWDCWRWDITTTTVPVPPLPLPGEAYWLLVTATSSESGEGSLGLDGMCQLRTASTPCP